MTTPKHLVPEGGTGSRPRSIELDDVLGRLFRINDGFISVIDYMGSDAAVVAAAASMASMDDVAMKRLLLHQHMSPLQAYHIKLHVVLPVHLARQWLRLRTIAQRDMSTRYATLESEFFVPSDVDCARGGHTTDLEEIAVVLNKLKAEALDVFQEYEGTGAFGFTAHHRTKDFPGQEQYTQFCWSVSVANLLHFLHPNWGVATTLSIPEYHEVLEAILQEWLPSVWKVYQEYGRDAITLNERDRIIIQRLLAQNNNVQQFDMSASDGDKKDILVKLRSMGFNPAMPSSH